MNPFTQKECTTDAKAQFEQLDAQYGDNLRTVLHEVLDERAKEAMKQVQVNVLAEIRDGNLDIRQKLT